MHSEQTLRRRHGGELKAQVLAQCDEPGASIAAVAQAHGLNANLVHKWRRGQRQAKAVTPTQASDALASTFVALQLPAQPTAPSVAQDIRIELRRGRQPELALQRRIGVRGLVARAAAVIRIDAVWLAVRPVDMRCGADRLLASVVQVFGAAQAHHGYLFANARATRIKLLVHDGFGVWCAARRLNKGSFEWPTEASSATSASTAPITLTRDQFDALVVGLPWQRLEQLRVITRM